MDVLRVVQEASAALWSEVRSKEPDIEEIGSAGCYATDPVATSEEVDRFADALTRVAPEQPEQALHAGDAATLGGEQVVSRPSERPQVSPTLTWYARPARQSVAAHNGTWGPAARFSSLSPMAVDVGELLFESTGVVYEA